MRKTTSQVKLDIQNYASSLTRNFASYVKSALCTDLRTNPVSFFCTKVTGLPTVTRMLSRKNFSLCFIVSTCKISCQKHQEGGGNGEPPGSIKSKIIKILFIF